MVPATGRATARRAALATVRSSTATNSPAGADRSWARRCSNARHTLVNISAKIAPELPWADRIAACTIASRLARLTSGTAWAIPARVSLRFDPVSESDTGKTFITLRASADSEMMTVARRSQWS